MGSLSLCKQNKLYCSFFKGYTLKPILKLLFGEYGLGPMFLFWAVILFAIASGPVLVNSRFDETPSWVGTCGTGSILCLIAGVILTGQQFIKPRK